MTKGANPDEPSGSEVLAQFLRDWTKLWRDDLQALGGDAAIGAFPGAMSHALSPDLSSAMELWRKTMTVWAETMGAPSTAAAGPRDRSAAPRSTAAAAASDARDAEIERLTRRVDALEARLAKLETPRRRRG
jgi:ubiquinone biosynthesis protein UbiJ